MKLKFYADAGHGWLAVKRDLLTALGIADKITPFSYQRGKTVYLEEDCDCATFTLAMETAKIRWSIDGDARYSNRSPIRSYASYSPF
jgi:hypothetical protein